MILTYYFNCFNISNIYHQQIYSHKQLKLMNNHNFRHKKVKEHPCGCAGYNLVIMYYYTICIYVWGLTKDSNSNLACEMYEDISTIRYGV